MKQEETIKKMIATYLRTQYPKIIFRFDIGADIKLPVGLAIKSKRIHQHHRGYPDLFIAKKINSVGGLYLEIKTDENQVYKKKGGFLKKPHIQEQNEMLKRLNESGYIALYGFGFDDAKNKIDLYLSGNLNNLLTDRMRLLIEIDNSEQM